MPNSGTKKIVMDTYAWIEYFRGSEEGSIVRKYVDNDFELFTPAMVIAELSDKYRREGSRNWALRRSFIKLKSEILALDDAIADHAGELKQALRQKNKNAGLADAIILAHSIQAGAMILTGDEHLRNLENAINLKAL